VRRLLVLASLAAAAWWLLTRKRETGVRATIGYADGSAVSPSEGSTDHERLVAAARDALLQ
jgi:hypothetical protein